LDDIGHFGFAPGKRFLAVARLLDLELEGFENVPGDLADHLGVIDDQTAFHSRASRFPLRTL